MHATTRRPRSGSALLMVLILILVLMAMMSASFVSVHQADAAGRVTSTRVASDYVAESAAALAVADVERYLYTDPAELGRNVGELEGSFASVPYQTRCTPILDAKGQPQAYRIHAHAIDERGVSEVEVVLDAPPFLVGNALEATNRGGMANVLTLGDYTTGADTIIGDVYNHGDIALTGHASVSGVVKATGDTTVTGSAGGVTGVSEPLAPFDLLGMDYANSADIKVADSMGWMPATVANGAFEVAVEAFDAEMLPELDPAHVFLRNPDLTPYAGLLGYLQPAGVDAYLLMDPYVNMQGNNWAYSIDTDSGNHVVYYVKGDLFVGNPLGEDVRVKGDEATGLQITVVVEGNIYLLDNVTYRNKNKDMITWVAIPDADRDASAVGGVSWGEEGVTTDHATGNIILGPKGQDDETWRNEAYAWLESKIGAEDAKNYQAQMRSQSGTVTIEGGLFATHDIAFGFGEPSTGSSGITDVSITGWVAAGGRVLTGGEEGFDRPPISVTLDTRPASGSVEVPGMPISREDGRFYDAYRALPILSWRRLH